MSTLGDILGELKQRNVVRVGGVYSVTAWGIFQVFNTLVPVLGLPKWTSALVALLLLLGFPIALIVAWSLEKGPDGVHVAAAPRRGPKPKYGLTDWLLLGAMAAIVVVTAAQVLGFHRTSSRTSAADAAAAAALAANKSVAVLPFVNFSENRDGEFFADGLTEEIINSLAQVPELKVAGRTSAFYFKNKNTDLREIGRKLGVAHVMEGSVRRDGERIRVTVQLISVSDGFHMWSQTYDRTLSDSLALQTEIANTVAGVLKAKLAPAPAAHPPAASGQSYRLALVARARLRDLGQGNVEAARQLYQRIISIDPSNPAGYAGYAIATVLLAQDYNALDFDTARTQATRSVERALQLAPRSAVSLMASGLLDTTLARRTSDFSYLKRAETSLRTAVQLEPRNPDALIFYANVLLRQGRTNEAIAALRQAQQVDPLNRLALSLLANALADLGRLDDSVREYKSLIDLYPDYVDARLHLANVLAAQGKLDQAETWMRSAADAGDSTSMLMLAQIYLNLGMPPDARRSLMRMQTGAAGAVGQVAWEMASGDYANVLSFSQAQMARTKDPFWHDAIVAGAIFSGNYPRAVQELRLTNPELFLAAPQVSRDLLAQPLDAALALQATGDPAQATRILQALLTVTSPAPGRYQSNNVKVSRAQAFALLGDKEHALEELKSAVDAHYRTLTDLDHFVRLDRLPHTRILQGEPRFRALIATVDADTARMRSRVLAARAPVALSS